MIKHIEARGKQCPMPLILAKKALAQLSAGDTLEVSVDNEIAMENLVKLAVQKQLSYTSEGISEKHYIVRMEVQEVQESEAYDERDDMAFEMCEMPSATPTSDTVVVLSSDQMGEGEAQLGKLLLKGFIYSLTSLEKLPTKIIMYNNGAKLAIASSEVIGDLQLLEEKGVCIMTCGTCLDYYGIKDELAVGTVTNMYDIVETLAAADKIIKP
nr:sulfurtransferase-like selenium metabolism protein YedF [uncultured Cellulosilyticum sp.]